MVEDKVCCRCNKRKSLSEFGKDGRNLDGLKYHCKECHNNYELKWRKENKDRFKARRDRYNTSHKELINNYAKKYRKKYPSRYKNYSEKYRRKIKFKVLSHYSNGTPKCACCNEVEIDFLSIDHIYGGGTKHRREINMNVFHWLIRNNYPEGYQVLCFNCNLGKRINNGICPHQKL